MTMTMDAVDTAAVAKKEEEDPGTTPEGVDAELVDRATARKTGVSAYVGEGVNRRPAVHHRDAAVLFSLALGKDAGVLPGTAENVALRCVAETIARGLELPAVSLTPEEAAAHFPSPFMATFTAWTRPSPAHSRGAARLVPHSSDAARRSRERRLSDLTGQ